MSNKTAWARLYHNDVFIASHLFSGIVGEYEKEGGGQSGGDDGRLVGEAKKWASLTDVPMDMRLQKDK